MKKNSRKQRKNKKKKSNIVIVFLLIFFVTVFLCLAGIYIYIKNTNKKSDGTNRGAVSSEEADSMSESETEASRYLSELLSPLNSAYGLKFWFVFRTNQNPDMSWLGDELSSYMDFISNEENTYIITGYTNDSYMIANLGTINMDKLDEIASASFESVSDEESYDEEDYGDEDYDEEDSYTEELDEDFYSALYLEGLSENDSPKYFKGRFKSNNVYIEDGVWLYIDSSGTYAGIENLLEPYGTMETAYLDSLNYDFNGRANNQVLIMEDWSDFFKSSLVKIGDGAEKISETLEQAVLSSGKVDLTEDNALVFQSVEWTDTPELSLFNQFFSGLKENTFDLGYTTDEDLYIAGACGVCSYDGIIQVDNLYKEDIDLGQMTVYSSYSEAISLFSSKYGYSPIGIWY